jgi:hypothetical protein
MDEGAGRLSFETLGNASIQVCAGGSPLLVTDPWLCGKVYFGSWALAHPPGAEQIERARRSPLVWISHGHPDHLHPDSIALLDPLAQRILLPDHYAPDVREHLQGLGFEVTVMRYRRWMRIAPDVRIQCLEHANQDAMLLIELGRTLLIDRNDCPLFGEKRYLAKLIRGYEASYLAGLCAVETDMVNIVDAAGRRVLPEPEELKPGAIWEMADLCSELGVTAFCCSSSQHVYCRRDCAWVNPYRIVFEDMQRWWNAKDVELIGPCATVEVGTRRVTMNPPAFTTDWTQVEGGTGGDDWDERLAAEEWTDLERFFRRFELLPARLDFVRFTVGGETRTLWLHARAETRSPARRRGVHFRAPRQSLLETIRSGCFDDLLVSNFVQTELTGLRSLYPAFTPIVAKLGGMAKVHTRAEARRFRRHYLRLSPRAYLSDRLRDAWLQRAKPRVREVCRRLRILEPLKRLDRFRRGLPPLPARARST